MEIYNSSWIGLSPKLIKSMIVVIRRSQKPITMRIGGIMPRLSLSYYAHFLPIFCIRTANVHL
ncbi:uncharacterized protein LOC122498155 [Leptopilina heterotoma]|uniref:uncharacterized protein LOC122498155 n=1 Tax=Leptopilina heterotoma TaxID=63436 RepID=UPI001CA8C40A|nr:uncharacterized protein LOC122498155 [Leptopilina heterotoma]